MLGDVQLNMTMTTRTPKSFVLTTFGHNCELAHSVAYQRPRRCLGIIGQHPSNEQGELTNRWLQMNWLSLRNNQLKFKMS
jgi:hypothetical protein